MASNNKRRETTRRQLEQRLQERQHREAARKRAVLIGSVVGTIVVIAVILVLVFTLTGGSSSKKKPQAGGKGASSPTASTSTTPTPTPTPTVSADPTDTPCKVANPKGSVVFQGVTITNPTDLTNNPDVTSCSKITPKTLQYKDLVVGKGATPTAKSTVSVQYAGVFYQDGYAFDSSWKDTPGKPATFSLAQVVPGFTEAIAGAGKIPPMKTGGRRIVVLPAALAYADESTSQTNGIPPNTPLVFVIDLTAVK